VIAHRYKLAIATQLKSLFRLPAYWVPILLFPVMLFAMFGAGGSGISASYRMASFVIYGVIGVAFFQFGVAIAQDRESNWERYRRTLPNAFGPLMVSRLVSALVFVIQTAGLVIAAALFLSDPAISPGKIIALLLASLLIVIPFTLLSIALGYWTNSRSAVAVANLLYLPLAYLGGLWMPPDRLPEGIASLSQFTPTRHAGEIGWAIIGARQLPAVSVIWLIGFTLIFAALAYWGYQRDQRKRFA